MTENNQNIGIIILAAGASVRFGQPKQLLQFDDESLIRRAAKSALESNCDPVIVVLGANVDLIKNDVENLECEIVFNKNWHTGMSSTVEKGLKTLLEISPVSPAVIIALSDQPFVQSEHFDRLIDKFFETKKPIIASLYEETIGVPALFAREVFPALMNLDGDKGAQEIIKNNPAAVETILLPEAAIDIDTRSDLEKIKNYKL